MDFGQLVLFVAIMLHVGGTTRCSVVTRRYIKDEVCISGTKPSPTTLLVQGAKLATPAPKIDRDKTIAAVTKKPCTSTPFHLTGVRTGTTFCIDTPGWCVGEVMTFDATLTRETGQFLLDNGGSDLPLIVNIKIATKIINYGFYVDGVRKMPFMLTLTPFPIHSGSTHTFVVEATVDRFRVFLKERFLFSHHYPGKYKDPNNISKIKRVCFTDMDISKMSKIEKDR